MHDEAVFPCPTNLNVNARVDVTTLYENFEYGCAKDPTAPCLGYRSRAENGHLGQEYEWITYESVQHKRSLLGSFLVALAGGLIYPQVKFHKTTGWCLGIYSINRPEWVLAEQSCNAYSLISIALYDTLGKDSVKFIVNHADIPVVITSSDKIVNLLGVVKECEPLKLIISMDALEDPKFDVLKQWAKDRDVLLLDWPEVFKIAQKYLRAAIPPTASDVASICYTSGTTGDPKGAILTHSNYVSAIHTLLSLGLHIGRGESHISYLPLAHCFERVIQVCVIFSGACIGFYSGDILNILGDIQNLRPTLFISVPRLLNKIYATVKEATIGAGGMKGVLFRQAYSAKRARVEAGGDFRHGLWDRLLFSKVAGKFGGRIKYVVSGSAPINYKVLQFLRIVLSAHVFEGYGTTESSACGTITHPLDSLEGSVGVASVGGAFKLVSVPDLNYKTSDKPFPRGEILLRGPYVFRGYHKSPEQTGEALTEDGWLMTGDIGTVDAKGRLYVIDRKKHVFKLAQGEYIAPEKLERIYLECPVLSQIFIDGDSKSSFLVAVVVLDESKSGSESKKEVLKQLEEIAKVHRLSRFEHLKDIYIEKEPFSIENNLLTPTLKLKRHEAKKRYATQLREMYSSHKDLAKL